MRYRLAVLTHGRSEPLEESLRSFFEHVSPLPTNVRVYADGAGGPSLVFDAFARAFSTEFPEKGLPAGAYLASGVGPLVRYPFSLAIQHPSKQEGFCGATAALWDDAVAGDEPFVFWLEHDFVFKRDVDLVPIGQLLSENRDVAQVALVRNPVNVTEIAAGGLIESRPGEFETETFWRNVATDYLPGGNAHRWLRHRSFFTTNPSLMRREFMAAHPFPDYSRECEGRFGIDLVAAGFSFGFWGDGTPWVEHVGVRDGFGY